MKTLYTVGSVFFTVLILIVAFGNIAAQCSQVSFLFSSVRTSTTVMIFGVSIFGIIAGMFYHALLVRIMNDSNKEDYDEDDEF